MPAPIAMPKLGITMEEGTVVEWVAAIGTPVEKGQVVLLIESEKAEVEVEAPIAGVMRHHYAAPGDVVPCGTLLGAITDRGDDDFDAARFEAAQAVPDAPRPAIPARAPITAQPTPVPGLRRAGRRPATPAARVKARALDIDLARVPGTGPGGRITRGDVADWAERRKQLVAVAAGVSLDVPRYGTGALVLLLPGLGTDASVFAQQVPVLAERHQVLGVNPRGVAGSDAPAVERYDLATAAADVAAVAGGPAHIVGASLGAAVAIELALTAPERVRSLTLITPFVTVGARLDAVADAWARLADTVAPDMLARTLLPWFFSLDFLQDTARRERVLRGLAATVARVPAATVQRALAGLTDWSGSRTAQLAQIRVPTLVIAAGGDLLTPDAAAVAAAIPGATCLVVPAAGHAVTIESPDDVSRAILAHVSSHS